MRIMTVRPPWSNLIINHGKDVENRSTNIAGTYRGPVAIHAGLRQMPAGDRAWHIASAAGMDTDRYDGEELHLGHIIGVVDLVDVHVGPESGGGCHKLNSPLPVTPTYDLCSQWGEAGSYHLVLANPRALEQPIPYRGRLGLRTFNATTDAEILRALEALS
ncbi:MULTISPECIES: hypothetical protein [unclassified Microbacterium]|uniref:hypothetical protein n=1 Tax=unclassified Microbacterium TaxID=2609290 RepID=UPI00341F4BE2